MTLRNHALLTFDHIGVVTADIDRSARTLAAMFGATEQTIRYDDEVLGVSARFVRDPSGIVYELIAPLGQSSPVARALQTKTNLLNHVAYRTSSLKDSTDHLRDHGCIPVGPAKPGIVFGGAQIQFLLSELGFIVELIENLDFRYQFDFDPLPPG